MTVHVVWPSPLGELTLVADGDALAGLYFPDHAPVPATPFGRCDPDALPVVREQLEQYFAGERTTFALMLAPRGTPFQQAVWTRMRAIAHGETLTYARLAVELDGAHPRAVGSASAHNPISIVTPCHRMVASSGGLAGYAGGLARKRALLVHEGTLLTAGRDYRRGLRPGSRTG